MRFILSLIIFVIYASPSNALANQACIDAIQKTPFTAEQRAKYPILRRSRQPYGTWSYHLYKVKHIMPALKLSLKQARKDYKLISQNPDAPTFENTFEAMDDAFYYLENVEVFFQLRFSTHRTDDVDALAKDFSKLTTKFYTDLTYDKHHFKRVETLYQQMESGEVEFTQEQSRIIDKAYKAAVKIGLTLPKKQQDKLKKIGLRLSELSTKFSQNELNDNNSFRLHITDESKLENVPESFKKYLRGAAENENLEGFLVTFMTPAAGAIMKYSPDEDLRKQIWEAQVTIASKPNDKYNNSKIVTEMARLRHEKAQLLGYTDYAAMVIEDNMAKEPKAVHTLLNDLVERSYPAVREDLNKLREFKKKKTGSDDFNPWEVSYWSNLLRQELFDFDAEEFRAYFRYNDVLKGVFKHAELMYDLSFQKRTDFPTVHQDVDVLEVRDNKTDQVMALLYLDPYQRETKPDGAWASGYRSQHYKNGKRVPPIIKVKLNLPPPDENGISRLSMGDVNTFFHEIGHFLHGALSDVQYRTLAGTNVARDFVELPSQLMENFLEHLESLNLFASHEDTGKPIPAELLRKYKEQKTFLQTLSILGLSRHSLLDLAWHSKQGAEVTDVKKFETDTIGHTYFFEPHPNSLTSASFGHIFNGGYAAGVYGYLWAQILDAQAFASLLKAGLFSDKFREEAQKFRQEILSKGGSKPEGEMFEDIYGKIDITPFLTREGLLSEDEGND